MDTSEPARNEQQGPRGVWLNIQAPCSISIANFPMAERVELTISHADRASTQQSASTEKFSQEFS